MTDEKKIRVLVADDFKVLRDTIRLDLERIRDIEVVDEVPDLGTALERALTLRPDVIIVNDYLPPADSALAAQLFRAANLNSAILTISMALQPDLIDRSFRSGINGFMHKEEIEDYLIIAIRSVYEGNIYLSPRAQQAYNNFPI